MDRTTLNANLKPLERRGLLTSSVDDRRSRRLTLTPAGRALLIKAFPVWKRTQAATESLLGHSNRIAYGPICASCRRMLQRAKH
jgi:DNA-binding MarR family transcriptional regulator